MSVEREGSLTRFVCDEPGCHRNYEVHDETFQRSWAEARSSGWVAVVRFEQWQHACKECAKELGDD